MSWMLALQVVVVWAVLPLPFAVLVGRVFGGHEATAHAAEALATVEPLFGGPAVAAVRHVA